VVAREAHQLALQRAVGAGEGIRPVRATERDQSLQSRGMVGGEREADHRAVGGADEGLQARYTQFIEDAHDRGRLVARVQWHVEVATRAEPIAGDQAVPRGIQCATGADSALPPAGLLVEEVAGDMPVGRDSAGYPDDRRIDRPLGLDREPHPAPAGVAQVELEFEAAALHRGRACRRRGVDRDGFEGRMGTVGKAHRAFLVVRPTQRAPARPESDADADREDPGQPPSSGGPHGASAGFGTLNPLARTLVAPASKGLSLCRSGWIAGSTLRPSGPPVNLSIRI